MATVADILRKKGREVQTIRPEETVLGATRVMNDHKIGALVVSEAGHVVGMFTERDVLTRVVVEGRDPQRTRVGEVMTSDVACCRPDTPLEEAQAVMANRRIRHLPVCDAEGRIGGIISIGDLNAWEADGKELTIQWLNEYIAGGAGTAMP